MRNWYYPTGQQTLQSLVQSHKHRHCGCTYSLLVDYQERNISDLSKPSCIHKNPTICGQDTQNTTAVHKMSAFRGQDSQKPSCIHKNPTFCGQDTQNTTAVHKMSAFPGQDSQKPSCIHKNPTICGQDTRLLWGIHSYHLLSNKRKPTKSEF